MGLRKDKLHTGMFCGSMHSFVAASTLALFTPGGFRDCRECNIESSSWAAGFWAEKCAMTMYLRNLDYSMRRGTGNQKFFASLEWKSVREEMAGLKQSKGETVKL